MNSKEIHLLCSVPLLNSAALGSLLTVAAKHGLRIGKAKSTSDDIFDVIAIKAGDVLIELIGMSTSDADGFKSRIASSPKLDSISVTSLAVDEISVNIII